MAGKIGDDDIVIAEVWPTEVGARPEARWLLNGSGRKGLSEAEDDVLLEIMQERIRAGEKTPRLPLSATIGWGRKRVETDWSALRNYLPLGSEKLRGPFHDNNRALRASLRCGGEATASASD